MFSIHNGIKLEINSRMIFGKVLNNWKINNTPLNNLWDKEENKKEIRKYSELNENENTTYYNLWSTAKADLEESLKH